MNGLFGVVRYAFIQVNDYISNDSVKWYYPYEFVIGVDFYNKTDSSCTINIYDQFQDNSLIDGNFILANKADTFFIGPKCSLKLASKDSIGKAFFIMDFPFFKKAFNHNDLEKYFLDLSKNANVWIRMNQQNSDVVNIYFSEDYHIKFLHYKDGVIPINMLGVPDSLEIDFSPPQPAYGIEY